MEISTTIFILLLLLTTINCEDYYQLLGVSRQASDREIRRAFKRLAISHHPDKNTGDPDAHDNFLKINRAYEVLKDADLRKKYDTFGEEGLKDGPTGGGYQSWNFYNQNFGIYDDDPEIITLNLAEFDSVEQNKDVWFVNFYSPHCGHCHEMAPTWRELARELQGVVRFGAVNCEDEWMICQRQQIHSYPSLVAYPSREMYHDERNLRELRRFALRHVKSQVHELWSGNFDSLMKDEELTSRPWLLSFCGHGGDCLEKSTSIKLAAMLVDLANVAIIDCHEKETLCDQLGHTSGTVYYPKGKEIHSLDAREIKYVVLAQLDDLETVDKAGFETLMKSLTDSSSLPWLLHFVDGEFEDVELRTLPYVLSDAAKVGRVDCSRLRDECNSLHISKFPTFAVFKRGGGHEFHHGRHFAPDVASFVRDVAQTKVTVLGPDDFPLRVVENCDPWFVDFFAPWCPPCMRLLPEFRKASKSATGISFGTVDCTIHTQLCQNYNIRSYPTTIFFNNSTPFQFQGQHNEHALLEFIQDTLSPPVTSLTHETFVKVSEKTAQELWMVDFFAPWCGPCQQLAPEWRRLAKMFVDLPEVHIAQVDCQAQGQLCREQGVNSYPSIRLYPAGQVGGRNYQQYTEWFRDAQSLHAWAFNFLPSPVKGLSKNAFMNTVLSSQMPYLVDYYAPWCGHCQVFAPHFVKIAKTLEKFGVGAAKVDCESSAGWICQQAQISHYPTVRFYPGAKKAGKSQDFYGIDITSTEPNDIIEFVKSKIGKTQAKDEL